MKIDKEYLIKEMVKFREIMGSRKYTVEQISKALQGLLTVYVNCKTESREDEEYIQNRMDDLCREHDKRLELRLIHNI